MQILGITCLVLGPVVTSNPLSVCDLTTGDSREAEANLCPFSAMFRNCCVFRVHESRIPRSTVDDISRKRDGFTMSTFVLQETLLVTLRVKEMASRSVRVSRSYGQTRIGYVFVPGASQPVPVIRDFRIPSASSRAEIVKYLHIVRSIDTGTLHHTYLSSSDARLRTSHSVAARIV
ncbi:hypothetical protein EXIGLDRAFT_318015 [Exidia glandulosa HHB12029]|uniref:Secreted protein n=1 Tax=Exidia glandulosa HHB12029 TaxID=1314781 RepID=A0A165Q1T9_EXIGL|nr:hypothetical protein EXIGLDRAFT_318015 [Exidia glandulosa HHB12029]